MNIKKYVFTLATILALSSCVTTKTDSSGEASYSESSESSITSDSQKESSSSSSKSEASSSKESSSETSSLEPMSSSESSSQSSSSSQVDPETPLGIQDGAILHAFNWSLNNVKNELANIKKAGYTAVQLSPMQPQKDYYQGHWSQQWWKLYQPYGFSVASSNQNVLGNKNDLISLCNEAKKQGVKIIVDVVTNHLAGGSRTSLNGNVNNFEKEIYENNLIHSDYGEWAKDTNLRSIVQGNIGDYPDLKTEDSRVQNRVISMLKEYCDCGIDGFRFDAAKHIETPNDGTYASNYWPNVIGSINDYYVNKGLDKPYIYGEILTTCGTGRNYSSYTTYMSTIDNTQATDLLNAVKDSSTSKIKTTYNTKVDPNHLVLWAESHDTYSNDNHETTYISSDIINKTYMIQASRKEAATLYLVRPGNSQMGEIGTTDYKKASIRGANLFHNYYNRHNESISVNDGLFINVRGDGFNNGAAIINVSNSSSKITTTLPLANGSYKDLITGSKVSISSGSASISFTDGACFLVPENVDPEQVAPSIDITSDKEVFKDNANIKISVNNATTSSYSINGGSAVNFDKTTSFSIGNGLSNGEINIKVTASNNHGTSNKTISLLKTSLADKKLIIKNVTDNSNTYLIWSWPDGGNGAWYDASKDNNMLGYDFNDTNYIVVKFPSGTTKNNANWDNKLGQTDDLRYSNQVIDFKDLSFK